MSQRRSEADGDATAARRVGSRLDGSVGRLAGEADREQGVRTMASLQVQVQTTFRSCLKMVSRPVADEEDRKNEVIQPSRPCVQTMETGRTGEGAPAPGAQIEQVTCEVSTVNSRIAPERAGAGGAAATDSSHGDGPPSGRDLERSGKIVGTEPASAREPAVRMGCDRRRLKARVVRKLAGKVNRLDRS